MGVLNIVTSQTGLVGVIPRVIFINTNNTSSQVQATGFLNKEKGGVNSFSAKDMALVYTTDAGLLWMDVVVTSTNISLTPNGNSISAHDIQAGIFTSAPDTGLADAYIVNLTPAFNPLTDGALFTTVFQSANTGASTITVNGATYDLVDIDGSPLAVGAILIGQFGLLGYDGTNVQLLNSALDGSLSVLPSEIQDQVFTFADDDGAANTYHADYSPAITAYVKGMRLTFNTINANTLGATFAANALAAKAIVLSDGSALSANDIPANSVVDVMLRDDGDWQLMSAAPASGSGVSPSEIQNQSFVFAVDSGVADALVVAFNPPFTAYADGMSMEVQVLANNTTSPTIDVDGLGPVDIYDISGNSLAPDDLVVGGIAKITRGSGYMQLLNPATGTMNPITRLEIQNQSFTFSADSGAADAYVGTYTPVPSLQSGTSLMLEIANTNLTTSPTFNCGDGSGPLPITLGDGSAPPIGSMPAGLQARLTLGAGNNWQLENPDLHPGATTAGIQIWATALAPFVFTNTTNIVYDFDAAIQPTGPVTYNGTGSFTFPSDAASSVWQILVQLVNTSGTVDNVRLEITAPFTNTIAYVYPVTVSAGQMTLLMWSQSIAADAVVQVQFDASVAGQFTEGAGIANTLLSYITITRLP